MSDLVSSFNWSESDYSNVLFLDVPLEYCTHGTIVCTLEILPNVPRSSDDYVGLYQVGFKDINENFGVVKITDDVTIKQIITFNIEHLLPSPDVFYQFLYVGRNNTVHGASTPFIFKDTAAEGDAHSSGVDDEDYVVVDHPHLGENFPISVQEKIARKMNELSEDNSRLNEQLEIKARIIIKMSQDYEGLRQCKEEELLRFAQDMEQQAQKERKVYEEKLGNSADQIKDLTKQLSELSEDRKNLNSQMDELLLKFGKLHHSMDMRIEQAVAERLTQEKVEQTNEADTETADSLQNLKSLLEATEASRQLCLEELRHQKVELTLKLDSEMMDNYNSTLQIAKLKEQFAKLNAQLGELKEENIRLKNNISSLEMELKSSCAKIQELEFKNDEESDFLEQSDDMKTSEFSKESNTVEKPGSLTDRHAELVTSNQILEAETDSLQRDLIQTTRQFNQAMEALDIETARRKCSEDENLKLTLKLDSEMMDNYNSTLQIAKLKEQFAKVSKDFAECETLRDQLQMEIHLLKQDNFKLTLQCDGERIIKSGLSCQLDHLRLELSKVDTELSKMCMKYESHVQESAESINILKADLAGAKKHLADASELYKAQYIEILGLKKKIQESKKTKHNAVEIPQVEEKAQKGLPIGKKHNAVEIPQVVEETPQVVEETPQVVEETPQVVEETRGIPIGKIMFSAGGLFLVKNVAASAPAKVLDEPNVILKKHNVVEKAQRGLPSGKKHNAVEIVKVVEKAQKGFPIGKIRVSEDGLYLVENVSASAPVKVCDEPIVILKKTLQSKAEPTKDTGSQPASAPSTSKVILHNEKKPLERLYPQIKGDVPATVIRKEKSPAPPQVKGDVPATLIRKEKSPVPVVDAASVTCLHPVNVGPPDEALQPGQSRNEVPTLYSDYVEYWKCPACDDMFPMYDGVVSFIKHDPSRDQQQVICPFCGLLFESNASELEIQNHVEKHF